ncbi:cupin domain-containing protein [uncultured Roseibium sp.]|uniref:cupin domain-containing protein n=1 Tax=uncultured Roseibium sp. TaxID=1936171 RepID=UPI002636ADF1|nr:cupin domain-containing protein [uncultured Roseibium sp.]
MVFRNNSMAARTATAARIANVKPLGQAAPAMGPGAVAAPETTLFSLSHLNKDTLKPSPIDQSWILEGNPQARCHNLFRIADNWTSVDHWSCTSGKFRWQYFFDETILILEGEAFITDDDGVTYHAVPGTTLSFPDGSAAIWEVPSYIRKVAFNQKSVPSYLHKLCRLINKIHRNIFT